MKRKVEDLSKLTFVLKDLKSTWAEETNQSELDLVNIEIHDWELTINAIVRRLKLRGVIEEDEDFRNEQ